MSEFRGSRFDAGARETSSFFRPFDGPLFVNRTTVKGDPWTRLDCHGTTIWLHRETGEHRVQPEHPDAPRQSGATRVAPEPEPVPSVEVGHGCEEKPNDFPETLIYLTFHDERFFALVTKFKAEGLSPHLAVQAAFRLVTLYP